MSRVTLLALQILVAVVCVAALSVSAAARTSRDGERTVTLVARDMAFFLSGADVANPRLVVERGERVRFVLRNEDPGMAHDFALPSLDEATPLLREAGTAAELVVRAPEAPGEHEYVCTTHSRMMRGVLEVR